MGQTHKKRVNFLPLRSKFYSKGYFYGFSPGLYFNFILGNNNLSIIKDSPSTSYIFL